MARVTVAYDDLDATSTAMTTLNEYVKEVHTEITEIKTAFEEQNSKHDSCFNDVINALDDLEHAFRNYYNEVDFLASQCKKASEAFKTAEGESADASKELTAGMKEVLGSLAAMAGLTDAEGGWNVDDITMDDIEAKSTRTDIETQIAKSTATQRSETWSRVFEDEDDNGVYDKINGSTVSESESIIGDDKDQDKDKDSTQDDQTTDDTNYDNDNGGGGGGGGNSHRDTQYRIRESSDEEQKKLEEEKKKDPIEETEPKEEEKKEEQKEEEQKEETPQEEQKEETPQEEQKEETPQEETPKEEPKQETPQETPKEETVTYHTGGGYSGDGGYTPAAAPENTTEGTLADSLAESENTTEGVPMDEEVPDDDIIGDMEDNIVKSDEVTKIPVSNDPISTKETKGGSSVIPIAAGLSAAAAAGLGAKAYMDHKRNNSDEDDEEFESEDWNGDESTDIDYGDSAQKEEYLDDDDYVASEVPVTEKYGARNNEELADLQ